MSSSTSKKRKKQHDTSKLKVKKIKNYTFDYNDGLSSGEEADPFAFGDEEAEDDEEEEEPKKKVTEEISFSYNPDDEAEEGEEASEGSSDKKRRLLPLPVLPPEYVALNIFEEKSNCAECWGCMYRFGSSRIRSKNSTADKIYETFTKNKKDLPLEALCTLLEDVHEKLIYEPSIRAVQISKKGVAVEPWPYETVMSHLKHHMQDPNLKLKAMYRDNEIIETALKNTLMEYKDQGDGTKKPEPSFKNILIFTRFQNHQLNVFKNAQFFESIEQSKARN